MPLLFCNETWNNWPLKVQCNSPSCVVLYFLNSPVHEESSPVYPPLHSHLNDPGLLIHLCSLPHVCVCVAHSSISEVGQNALQISKELLYRTNLSNYPISWIISTETFFPIPNTIRVVVFFMAVVLMSFAYAVREFDSSESSIFLSEKVIFKVM